MDELKERLRRELNKLDYAVIAAGICQWRRCQCRKTAIWQNERNFCPCFYLLYHIIERLS